MSEILYKNTHLHLVTGELVHDPWAAYLTGQHYFLQPGSSLGRRTVALSSRARRDPVKRSTDILHDGFKGNTWQSGQSHRKLDFGILHKTLQVELGWSMVSQLKLSKPLWKRKVVLSKYT